MPLVIPNELSKGFHAILNLSEDSVQKITEYLKAVKISVNPNEILNQLESYLKTELKVKEVQEIVQAIASMGDLEIEESSEKLAKELTETFFEYDFTEFTDEEVSKLTKTLILILDSSGRLRSSIKSFRLIRENNKVYYSSRVISDIRLIFDENIDSDNKKAVLVHNLHIKYSNNSDTKDFFVSLDLSDLESLHKQIERAIRKDKIIRDDFKNLEIL